MKLLTMVLLPTILFAIVAVSGATGAVSNKADPSKPALLTELRAAGAGQDEDLETAQTGIVSVNIGLGGYGGGYGGYGGGGYGGYRRGGYGGYGGGGGYRRGHRGGGYRRGYGGYGGGGYGWGK